MDKHPVIEVKNISKVYPRRPQLMRKRDDTFASFVSKRVFKKQMNEKVFYACKDISFSVYPGESVGLVGDNGAGKSTLLRVITGITMATSGEVKIHGKYGELFALNAGFNTNLSGRKNIYLIGAIKGFSNKEISKIEEKIIAFSELDPFIDQSVKTYSSGMRGRLGFSILIHLLPDIIFIDEALATGDIKFREKSLARLEKMVSDQNKTLMMVSHSIDLLRKLCSRIIWMEKGQIVMDGETQNILDIYEGEG